MSTQSSNTTFRIEDYFSPAMLKIMQQMNRFEQKTQQLDGKVSNAYKGMSQNIEKWKVKNIGALNDVASEMPGLGRAMQLAGNPLLLTGAGIAGVGAGLFSAGKQAAAFADGMAKANVTAQLTPIELKKVSDRVLEIGANARSRTGLAQVPQVFERIISAGLNTNTALATLKPTLEAAKAGFTDVETVASAAVGVMNSSGVQNATRVYDILFATLNKGNAQFADIAQYLPKIVPSARTAGFALEETAGAFAYLTAQGQTSERSATLLENAFKALSNPEKIKAFEKMKVALFDDKGKRLPILNIVEQVKGKLTGLSDKAKTMKLGSLGLDMEAASAFATMTQNTQKLSETILFAQNSQGQLNKAIENARTPTDSYYEAKHKMEKLMVKLGDQVLPVFTAAMDKVNIALEWINQNGKPIWDFFKGIGQTISMIMTPAMQDLVGALAALKLAQIAFNLVAAMNPYVRIAAGILIAVGAMYSFYQNSEKARAIMDGIWAVGKQIYSVFESIGTIVAGIFSGNLLKVNAGIAEFKKAISVDLGTTFDGGYYASMRKSKEEKLGKVTGKLAEKGLNPDGSKITSKTDADTVGRGVKSILSTDTGASNSSSAGVRNVTVNITKLVEKIEINYNGAKQDQRNLEDQIKEVLIKAVRNSELALSSD